MKKVISFISVFVACFAFLFVIASCDNSNSNTDKDKQETVAPVEPERSDETEPSNPDVPVNPGTDDDVYYTITFKNYDGTILQSSSVKKGETPTFNKSNPTRISNDNYSYEFKGWNLAITVANEDAEYIATYDEFVNEYVITWKNYDGEVLEVDQNVSYGTVPEYNGVKPKKSNTEEFAYSFIGWDKEITSVTRDTTYIATYNEFVNEYTITWKNYDGEVLEVDQNVPYGTVPEYNGVKPQKSNAEEFAYSFIGWDKEITSVTGDTTYIAEYEVYSLGLEYTLNASENEYIVSGNSVNTNEIIIPSNYNGLPVTSIESYAFRNCSSLTSITIPDSVTSIGSYAFYGCYRLVEVINKSSISMTLGSTDNGYIGYYAKQIIIDESDSKLSTGENGFITYNDGTDIWLVNYIGNSTKIVIPNNVTKINDYAFYDCSSLTSITIPDSVTSIGSHTFYECTSLTSITIPNSVTRIGEWAFSYCTSLTSITIPDSVTSIGSYAFSGCSSLTSITIPDSVTSIGERAFRGCSLLTSVVIGDSVTSIGIDAFYGCSLLTSVVIGDGVTSIRSYAFYGCSLLTSVVIGDSVTSIGSGAFQDCSLLTSVVIGDGVTSIGGNAFYNCRSLMCITIPDSVTSIGDGAFSGCSSLTSITIPDSVTSIGSGAFRYCYRLVEVMNKSSLSITLGSTDNGYIGYYAKQIIADESDSKLSTDENGFITYNDGTDIWLVNYIGNSTEIVIPNNVTKINDYAFCGCSSLTSITIPDSVTSIGSSAFSSCYRLVEVINKSSLSITSGSSSNGYIGYYAKQIITDKSDSKLSIDENGFVTYNDGTDIWLVNYIGNSTEIVIPNNVTEIKDYAFCGCRSLTSITIPDSVTSIGSDAFYNCTFLTSVVIGGSVISIGDGAFVDCISLTSITIPDSVTSIGSYAFYNCSSLINVVIPNSVTSIGGVAFHGCSSLTSITIPDSVTSIGSDAFRSCSSLENVYYDGTVEDWCNIILDSSSYSNPMSYATNFYILDENGDIEYNGKNYKLLTELEIPSIVTSIGNYQFYEFNYLTNVTIPDSVTSIGSYAFYKCTSLTSITIPDSVTSIGSDAFYKCSSLISVYYNGSESDWLNINIGTDNDGLSNATKYYFTSNGADETNSGNWWYYDTDGKTIIEKVIS